jgi:phasin family protein
MLPIQDQISATTRAGIESQIALYTTLTSKMFEGMEKLVHLNIAAVRASVEESSEATRQMLAAKDPQEFLTAFNTQARPNIGKALAYGNHLVSIASSTQAEVSRATEKQLAEARRKVGDMVENAADKTPAGAEGMVAIVKSALDNAAASYEQLNKSTRQAVEVMESNLTAAANSFAKASGQQKH